MSVLSADVAALTRASLPAPVWPTVAALARAGITGWSQYGDTMLPSYQPATAGEQPGEKQPLPASPITITFVDAPRVTFGNTVDLSLQARRHVRSQQPFFDLLAAATARQADVWLLDQLVTAAGDPLPSLSAALQAVAAAYGGPLLIVTSRVEGAADLAAYTRSSGLQVVVDPLATVTLAIATLGVALEAHDVQELAAANPGLLGVDLATYATLIGPVISPGAVAAGELAATAGSGVTWSDV